ncbi:MAG: hypothetical protein ACLPSW_09025 [Roseiarcus sp.]
MTKLDQTTARIVHFRPVAPLKAARGGAICSQIWRERLRGSVGSVLNWMRMPGAIRSAEITDKVSGQQISISVGQRFVRLAVDGRDYYFDRLTGRFDGTGSSFG